MRAKRARDSSVCIHKSAHSRHPSSRDTANRGEWASAKNVRTRRRRTSTTTTTTPTTTTTTTTTRTTD
eukprot:128427-Pyramimonas_sp.AAC.1